MTNIERKLSYGWILYTATAVYGLAYGSVSPIIPALAGSYFGTRSAGAHIGVISLAYTLGVATGPLLGGYVFDVSGSYFIAFTIAAVAAAIAFVACCLLLKPPRQPSHYSPA